MVLLRKQRMSNRKLPQHTLKRHMYKTYSVPLDLNKRTTQTCVINSHSAKHHAPRVRHSLVSFSGMTPSIKLH